MIDFKTYWEDKKEIFAKLGVTKDVVHMIWCDAIDSVHREVIKRLGI